MLKTTIASSVGGAASICLLATSVAAQAQQHQSQGTDRQAPRNTQTRFDPQFVAGADVIGAEVVPYGGEGQGEIDDLIVDRRTGRIVYGIMDTGSLYDLDGRTVAIPFAALAWNGAQEQFTLRASASQLKSLPAFESRRLAFMDDPTWLSTLRGIFDDQPEFRDTERMIEHDEYTSLFQGSKTRRIEGTVQSVERSTHGQQPKAADPVVLTVQSEANETFDVIVCPESWLLNQGPMPVQGDRVVVQTAHTTSHTGEPLYVARTLETRGKTVTLRDENGVPTWTANRGDRQSHLVLASQLTDGNVMARGEKFGSIDDIVVETNSGRIGFVTVGVGGVLGLNETLYPIPFEALVRGPETMAIGMKTDSLKLAPKLSKDGIADLNRPEFRKQVYDFFGMSMPKLDTNRTHQWSAGGTSQRGS